MGFFSWFWDLIKGIFSSRSRYGEEEEELKDYNKSARLTKKQKRKEKEEDTIEYRIVKELNKIRKELSGRELVSKIRLGQRVVTVEQAFKVLKRNVLDLIHTNKSLKNEEETLRRIVVFWGVLREGLLSLETQKDIREVDFLFEELGIIMKNEGKISWQKIQLVKKEYELIMREEGLEPKQQPQKVKV